MATAAFDPKRVEREGRPGDGDRWGWVTEIEVIASTDIDSAPTIDVVGVESSSLRRRSRLHLSAKQYQAAEQAIQSA
jgi:hypothetical protein